MSRFTTSLSVFMAGLALTNTKTQATPSAIEDPFTNLLTTIDLRPLNMPGDNLYAAHRSHSSHSSHRSSSGSYSAPRAPSNSYRSNSVVPSPPAKGSRSLPDNRLMPSTGTSQPVDPGRPATVTSTTGDIDPTDQALMGLVRRVQMALVIKGYDPGPVDGTFGTKTKIALKHFQVDHNLEIDGLMGTPTLNALGVLAK